MKKGRLSTTEIIKRLRTPGEQQPSKPAAEKAHPVRTAPQRKEPTVLGGRVKKKDLPLLIVAASCLVLLLVTLCFYLIAKNRAENLVAALDPGQVEGLLVDNSEFNPNTGVTYVQISEGQDRNVTVENSGTTLPIISRFTLKTFVDKNYELIGAAPWALTTNFASNAGDAELMRILLDNDKMIDAFLARPDVEPLVEDPQMLLAFAQDEAGLAEFFNSPEVQGVLQDQTMLRTTAGSRFMSRLLTSPSGRYFRAHPQEALQVINASPSLRALRANAAVQTAVKENPYLKNIASQLLNSPRAAATPARATTTRATSQKATSKTTQKTTSNKKNTTRVSSRAKK